MSETIFIDAENCHNDRYSIVPVYHVIVWYNFIENFELVTISQTKI